MEVPLLLVVLPLVTALCVSGCGLRASVVEDRRRCLYKSRSVTITPRALRNQGTRKPVLGSGLFCRLLPDLELIT